MSPSTRMQRAVSLTEVIAVVVVLIILLALLPWIFHDFLRPTKELSRRTVCAANLKGAANGFAAYAAANNDVWPAPGHMSAEADEVGRVTYAPGKIGILRGVAGDPEAGRSSDQETALSTTRAFWGLIRSGSSSPKSFICPSTKDDWYNDEENPQDFWDFRKYTEVSYGYQVPFGKHGRASQACDPEMVLIADKGPYGAALEAGKRNPGVPKPSSADLPRKWQQWNSPNHRGEGQNVMYADGHVDFYMTPLAGWRKDNIYTRWSRADAGKDANELARAQGTPPTGIETPWGETDSLIYP